MKLSFINFNMKIIPLKPRSFTTPEIVKIYRACRPDFLIAWAAQTQLAALHIMLAMLSFHVLLYIRHTNDVESSFNKMLHLCGGP